MDGCLRMKPSLLYLKINLEIKTIQHLEPVLIDGHFTFLAILFLLPIKFVLCCSSTLFSIDFCLLTHYLYINEARFQLHISLLETFLELIDCSIPFKQIRHQVTDLTKMNNLINYVIRHLKLNCMNGCVH